MLDDLLEEQIQETNMVLGLAPTVIHKDYFVTKVLHILTEVENIDYRLVFQGGTCLSKAIILFRECRKTVIFV